ncbi:MAG: DUF262 domain-containing protein [Truepera sp.]|nr:DUF262 domain-containing protein [Truepera sp.]
MREIRGDVKSIRSLLSGAKFTIDYYQREYRWETKQVTELIDDLTGKFLESHDPSDERSAVERYEHYFLGSIIISDKDGQKFIIDGQQRITSVTLLLIFLYRQLKDAQQKAQLSDLIFSQKFGKRSFNLEVPERTRCMEALFTGEPFNEDGKPESVVNILARFQDLEEEFPDSLVRDALPYFSDWLIENVHFVEITAYSDADAYTIFETMNDRGLSLSPTEMLKGYLLANMAEAKRQDANARWRDRIREFNDIDEEVGSDFFKAWFRSQYATRIRERKKGAKPEDFDRIGTEFHRWLRDSTTDLGLNQSNDFYRFIDRDFEFYSRQYLRLIDASQRPIQGLERVYYNAQYGFTLQNMLLLSPLRPDDSEPVIVRKVGLVAHYLDILLTWRIWNFRTISYSTLQYAMFLVMRGIRGLEPGDLVHKLYDLLRKEEETFASNDRLTMHQQNSFRLHRILARLTDYVETQSGQPPRYPDYVNEGKTRYEVEHILADRWDRHTDEFDNQYDFDQHRNRIGGLLLLPKSFNASLGDLSYPEKLPHYDSQNLLARSLHPLCYEHNPGFLDFKNRSSLPFVPHEEFDTAALEQRCELYRQIAERIWNPEDLLKGGPA